MTKRQYDQPSVSVLIPVYNEQENLGSCLTSVLNLAYPKELVEVIVIDNGSTDGSMAIACQYPVKIINASGKKIGAVRNAGANVARGEVIAYVDGDCVVSPDWINVAISHLYESNVGAVGGNPVRRREANWIERAWALEKKDGIAKVTSLATGSFILLKSTFVRAGGFNEDIVAGEDTALSRQIRQLGLELVLDSGCNVIHLGYPV